MHKRIHSADELVCFMVVGCIVFIYPVVLFPCLSMKNHLSVLEFRFRESWWGYKTVLDAYYFFSFAVKCAITRFALSQPCTAILLCIITNHQFFIVICVNTLKVYVFSSIYANSYGILSASLLSKMALVMFLKYLNCLAVFAHYKSFYVLFCFFLVHLK